jgi:hypothetical protein
VVAKADDEKKMCHEEIENLQEAQDVTVQAALVNVNQTFKNHQTQGGDVSYRVIIHTCLMNHHWFLSSFQGYILQSMSGWSV